jgi:zinc transport system permease protein
MHRTTRRVFERIGIGLTALLAVAMIAFLALEWLQSYPYAGTLYDQYLIAGMWLDYVLGTSVFSYSFMLRSIATGVLIGIAAPLVGTYLVHREMALIGETLAHTAFAGVAIGLLFSATTGWDGSLLLAALVVAVIGALLVQYLADRTNTYGDVPIAIMLTGSFAIGTLIISYGRGGFSGVSIDDYLFGSAAVIPAEGARMVAVLTIAVVGVVAATYKQLLFITFDEQAARVARLNVTWYNTLLIVMTAVVVVGAMQILGVILVAAMLVIPVAAASQIAHGFRETLSLSILFGQASILGGFGFAVWQGLPPGGSIVVVAIGIYLLSLLASGRSGTAISMH